MSQNLVENKYVFIKYGNLFLFAARQENAMSFSQSWKYKSFKGYYTFCCAFFYVKIYGNTRKYSDLLVLQSHFRFATQRLSVLDVEYE